MSALHEKQGSRGCDDCGADFGNHSRGAAIATRGVDTTLRIAQLRAVLKRIIHGPTWCKIIAAVVVCCSITCSKQILPQLIAQLASLDHDHGVSLHASSDGVHLVLTHDTQSFPENDEAHFSLALAMSQPAHVVHLITGPATAQSESLVGNNHSDVTAYFSAAVVKEWRISVPPIPPAYLRPPPDEMSILPLHRSTLLLI